MSGHNKWSQIKHQKAKTDGQKSKVFSKYARLIALESKKSGKTMTSKPDDLTKILGVTPKIQTLLKSESITTYVELGRCTIKKLLLILDIVNNKKKINYYTTWAKQAKLAAAGKWDELTELQKKIELEA
jgi:predicted flap endonuclease-1-like 5' DNA nuclease